MKKNAAIYARVSSDRQREQNTIASQTALLWEYAQSHDYVVPKDWIFEDEGYSGSVLNRPGLERLRDLACEGVLESSSGLWSGSPQPKIRLSGAVARGV